LINGSGSDYMDMSRGMGADCIITGDVTYHYASDYNEMGIAVIDAGHFGTEWPALKEVASNLKNKINKLGYNNSVLLSESTRDPYKTK
jgi:putative NIF3 family GTP cyclohydrolase 1 type 2